MGTATGSTFRGQVSACDMYSVRLRGNSLRVFVSDSELEIRTQAPISGSAIRSAPN
jgi:hypothetical protein